MYDLVIIGAGPGGYVCAIRAAQLGLKTALVEKDKTLGGTCLNVGCIPSKALLESSEHYENALHNFNDHGIKLSKVELDLTTMLGRKEKVVKDLTQGIAFLMRKNKVEVVSGTGRVTSANSVEVKTAAGEITKLDTKNIVLASGSVPVELPFLKWDENKVVSSTGALSLKQVPKHLVVIGAGVIGLELGSVWKRLGAEITVIEYASKICGTLDSGIATQFQKLLTKQGVKFLLEKKVTGAQVSDSGITLQYVSVTENANGNTKTENANGEIKADVVLVAIGRKPFSEGLGLKELGIEQDKAGRVIVNSHYQTNIPSIRAIGDLIAGPMLAHKAEEEGVAVAEYLAGKPGHVNYDTVPSVIYTWPEVACVGLSEEQLKDKNIPYVAGTFPFAANGRAKALGYTEGQVKILAHKDTDKILGVHILGPRASEIIAEAVIAMEFGSSSEDLARSFHAHPTLAETIREAALACDGRARQM
jgi:dihydrolipoamide dehydrogenase